MTDYSRWGKAYYETHKMEILTAEKDKKRWIDYYQKNKEIISEKNRRRYYERKGLPVAEKIVKVSKESIKSKKPDPAMLDRFEKLVEELRVLVPQVVKTKRTKKVKGGGCHPTPEEAEAEAGQTSPVSAPCPPATV